MSNRAVRLVLENSKAKGRHRLLLLVLAEHLNEQSRRCDPGTATLARECNCNVRDVHRQLAELAAAGEITIARGGGRSHCNAYTITAAANTGTGAILSEEINTGTGAMVKPINTGTGARKHWHGCHPNQNNHNNISQKEIGFDDFWQAYPRKVAKPRALKAWRASSKDRPTLPELLAAIEKHKASRKWQDPQFIPHPATWLNDHRWQDAPLPATSLPQTNGQARSCL